MATFMRVAQKMGHRMTWRTDAATLQCDNCTDFDAEGFALPKGRCWVPMWSDGFRSSIDGLTKIDNPDQCRICHRPLIGRM